jgi:hypothetical protein
MMGSGCLRVIAGSSGCGYVLTCEAVNAAACAARCPLSVLREVQLAAEVATVSLAGAMRVHDPAPGSDDASGAEPLGAEGDVSTLGSIGGNAISTAISASPCAPGSAHLAPKGKTPRF